jgi:probable HAF family extracellular repeat protein
MQLRPSESLIPAQLSDRRLSATETITEGAQVMPTYNYTTLDEPLSVGFTTVATGINFTGQIVGYYHNNGGTHGFLLSGGTYTTLDDPLGADTVASGINSLGQIVGHYSNASGNHGFLLTVGQYVTLDDPLATGSTNAHGINDAGQIVGDYLQPCRRHLHHPR